MEDIIFEFIEKRTTSNYRDFPLSMRKENADIYVPIITDPVFEDTRYLLTGDELFCSIITNKVFLSPVRDNLAGSILIGFLDLHKHSDKTYSLNKEILQEAQKLFCVKGIFREDKFDIGKFKKSQLFNDLRRALIDHLEFRLLKWKNES